MHLIRRTAFRAASSSPSSSFTRSINTSSPFVLRSKAQSAFATSIFRRFNSDEASQEKSSIESTDGEHGSIRSAINSAAKSASTYASEAAENVTDAAEYARDSVADAAAGAAAAVGGYQRREQRNDRQPYENRGYNGSGNGRSFGSDRGGRSGYGGDRGGYGNDRGRAPQERGSGLERVPDRVLTPTNSVYVGNLLFDVTDSDLRREFEQFGGVKNVIIATDARGLSKGFGYVEYETVEEATAAIEAKHQTVLEGRRLIVNYQNKTQRQARENPPSKTLFIGNLAFEMSDADLNKLFRDIRNVIDVRVAIDRRTGQPRGFAHADFVDVESAVKGKEALTGKEVYGRTLRVDFSAGAREGRGDGFGGARPGGRDDSRGDRF